MRNKQTPIEIIKSLRGLVIFYLGVEALNNLQRTINTIHEEEKRQILPFQLTYINQFPTCLNIQLFKSILLKENHIFKFRNVIEYCIERIFNLKVKYLKATPHLQKYFMKINLSFLTISDLC